MVLLHSILIKLPNIKWELIKTRVEIFQSIKHNLNLDANTRL